MGLAKQCIVVLDALRKGRHLYDNTGEDVDG